MCCLGENSYCADIGESTCAEIGGNLIFADSVCLGAQYELEDGTCCIGSVIQTIDAILGLNNESYICYNHLENNFISECCGVRGCNNLDNPLNQQSRLSITSTIHQKTGASYHMLSSFDAKYYAYILKMSINEKEEFSLRNNQMVGYAEREGVFIWDSIISVEGFDYLEFDFATNGKEYIKEIVIIDENGTEAVYPFSEVFDSERMKWGRVRLDLSDANDLNKKRIADIKFRFYETSTFQFLMDRLFLSVEGSDKSSDNRFCSGNFAQWIDNYDGPTDRGFFNNDGQPRSAGASFFDYGPYQEACDATMSFAWTGSACCGDDSFIGEDGEYWVDMQGVCWDGTPVLTDQTLASALSLDYRQRELHERSLLFHRGTAYACGSENFFENNLEEHYDVSFAFSQSDKLNNVKIKNKLTPKNNLDVVGNWMCREGEGWIRIEDMNRVSIMASILTEIANEVDSIERFTLNCGDAENVANAIPEIEAVDDVGALCLMRTGSNHDFIGVNNTQGEIFLAFEAKDVTTSVISKIPQLLLPYLDSAEDIDCTPKERLDNKFFYECDPNGVEQFHIYFNEDFEIGLIATDAHSNLDGRISFLERVWNFFVGFFQTIFGGDDEEPQDFITLSEFSDFEKSNQLYISKQLDRQVVGKVEIENDKKRIRVDYHNLTSNVAFLEDAIKNKEGNEEIYTCRNTDGNIQTIYVEKDANIETNTFNQLTSAIRLRTINQAPTNFQVEQGCEQVGGDR